MPAIHCYVLHKIVCNGTSFFLCSGRTASVCSIRIASSRINTTKRRIVVIEAIAISRDFIQALQCVVGDYALPGCTTPPIPSPPTTHPVCTHIICLHWKVLQLLGLKSFLSGLASKSFKILTVLQLL